MVFQQTVTTPTDQPGLTESEVAIHVTNNEHTPTRLARVISQSFCSRAASHHLHMQSQSQPTDISLKHRDFGQRCIQE